MPFQLKAPFAPTGDQPLAIGALSRGLEQDLRFQTLLGVTGSGKTFTFANVIQNLQRPTLVISHNKTLAAQLYEEFKAFFPDNAVHYFVSYYDYYQPEAYIPQTDTYIDKDVKINQELDRLRHAATQAILTRDDVIVVASVSCIYNIGSPEEYKELALELTPGQTMTQKRLFELLVDLQYERNDIDLVPGTFRKRGERVEIAPSTGMEVIVVEFGRNKISRLLRRSGLGLEDPERTAAKALMFPAKFWVAPSDKIPLALANIEAELAERLAELKKHGKVLEAQRLKQRTENDLAMIQEAGYCHGIENYSSHFEFRKPGEPPFTLLDYMSAAYTKRGTGVRGQGTEWLTIIDESHMTVPQLRGMVRGDNARKQILIDFGFRLPSARDNRPLDFNEFLQKTGQIIFASATPNVFEINISKRVQSSENRVQGGFVEQLIRPTGLLDPTIEIRDTKDQLPYLVKAIEERVAKKQRVLVTTLTKRLAEELTDWLKGKDIKVEYLHAEVKTLERPEVLHRLRAGETDVVVGINLLREGLDLPEVSLVAILDADKEGFLRNATTLIQTMGRAARHEEGRVILFADIRTQSMKTAISETKRRRKIQEEWNKKHGITPRTIAKPLRESTLIGSHREDEFVPEKVTPEILKQFKKEMEEHVKKLEFEEAARIRDLIKRLTARE
ncbi:MAG: excinuclease ABC subunit B [Candidatus Terrybacteria bacterium RIFCSPHIGHO2_01_FULL_48_17]|uniref:UvrABC system protein B n=1 Tax=Candidatus Terrybacteria bacterium RIFCSPHIGHO2_01_FULL_48_17 TaxID=1802362 RepID=A0A1G2PKI0_9BACT|nr:MAG: excinuclease ABC subunit B [Candidatus Terrybacteria bacterium RIFCSPHIGHO2_01_FULL_48_17]OHA53298.1 MAG: excinuclease ABC subunit B [Candidatus Terrybacteria bacterium RIFCSPLOWO2_01_FULL_48_14]